MAAFIYAVGTFNNVIIHLVQTHNSMDGQHAKEQSYVVEVVRKQLTKDKAKVGVISTILWKFVVNEMQLDLK